MIAAGIFLALCSVGFSFEGKNNFWFWQEYPFTAVGILLAAFLAVRWWLILEIDRQRELIRMEYLLHENNQTALAAMLSDREMQVLRMIATGHSNKEIAAQMFISISTVKTHINNIYKILEVRDRRAAIDKFEQEHPKR